MNDVSLPSGDLGLTPKDIGLKLSAKEGIEQARHFFQGHGFAIGENGFLKDPFLADQLTWLKKYRESRYRDSAEMPTQEDFYQQVLLATSLYPQVREDKMIQKVESIEGQEIRNKRYKKLLSFFLQNELFMILITNGSCIPSLD